MYLQTTIFMFATLVHLQIMTIDQASAALIAFAEYVSDAGDATIANVLGISEERAEGAAEIEKYTDELEETLHKNLHMKAGIPYPGSCDH